MSDIKSLHKTARTLILNLREGLEQLERSENVSDLLKAVQYQQRQQMGFVSPVRL